ncbi:50S ribosomal protein L4 [uncultured archaeon]|nr:50S ribosomal protein L4 [uncultured archaeon]
MKAQIYDTNGQKSGSIDLPRVFSSEVREDLISKVVEAKRLKQPFGPSPMAGAQHSASGIVQHRRHVWKSGYGRGMARVPRKIISQRGTQFNWIGAEVPQTRGGRRAHPPKVIKMLNINKINKKELQKALESAIAATASEKFLIKKYSTLQDKKLKIELPFVVSSKISGLKTKEGLQSIKKILGEDLFNIAVSKKSVRAGKGKGRGRPYKRTAGALMITGEKEKMKMTGLDHVQAKNLNVSNLAEGNSPGRLVLYTEQAIKEIGEKFK